MYSPSLTDLVRKHLDTCHRSSARWESSGQVTCLAWSQTCAQCWEFSSVFWANRSFFCEQNSDLLSKNSESLPLLFCKEQQGQIAHGHSFLKSHKSKSLMVIGHSLKWAILSKRVKSKRANSQTCLWPKPDTVAVLSRWAESGWLGRQAGRGPSTWDRSTSSSSSRTAMSFKNVLYL